MPAHGIGPPVELESLQQHERPGLGDALQHPEHAADVHQRRVDDRDAPAQLRSVATTGPVSAPITLRASMS